MIQVVLKKSLLSGYEWMDGSPANLVTYAKVKASTLKEAVDIALKKYPNKGTHWIKPNESYMLLEEEENEVI
jgi:hypothetical protein